MGRGTGSGQGKEADTEKDENREGAQVDVESVKGKKIEASTMGGKGCKNSAFWKGRDHVMFSSPIT